MTTTVTLIPGDGITRELAESVIAILDAAGADIVFEEQPAGADCYASCGSGIPDATIDSIRKNKIALKGKLLAPPSPEYPNPNSELRQKLDLFAAVRPIRNLRGISARHKDVDIVLIREISEDIYAGLEHKVREDIVTTIKVVTEQGCSRISRFAFEYAQRRNRKRVSLIHKANIMKITDGLFIRSCEKVYDDFKDIEFWKYIVDNACMQLLLRPHQFDVMLMGNLYGDIMSDLGAGIVGGISASMGAMVGGVGDDQIVIFEALHGDAPDLVGKNSANPLPFILPAIYMLEHLEQDETAKRIQAAVETAIQDGIVTADLGGTSSTSEVTKAIIARL